MNAIRIFLLGIVGFGPSVFARDTRIEKWDFYELSVPGPTAGNPFVGVEFSAVFQNGNRRYEADGFYDGNGTFKVRFMPDREGTWTYETRSNREPLDGRKGQFLCTPPSPGNHGSVRVRNGYHFEYADGTPFRPFGTTIYEWPFQSAAKRQATIETLKHAPFNKARFLIIPPWREQYNEGPNALDCFPFEGSSKENWDFSRFNPVFFQRVERCVATARHGHRVGPHHLPAV